MSCAVGSKGFPREPSLRVSGLYSLDPSGVLTDKVLPILRRSSLPRGQGRGGEEVMAERRCQTVGSI